MKIGLHTGLSDAAGAVMAAFSAPLRHVGSPETTPLTTGLWEQVLRCLRPESRSVRVQELVDQGLNPGQYLCSKAAAVTQNLGQYSVISARVRLLRC